MLVGYLAVECARSYLSVTASLPTDSSNSCQNSQCIIIYTHFINNNLTANIHTYIYKLKFQVFLETLSLTATEFSSSESNSFIHYSTTVSFLSPSLSLSLWLPLSVRIMVLVCWPQGIAVFTLTLKAPSPRVATMKFLEVAIDVRANPWVPRHIHMLPHYP